MEETSELLAEPAPPPVTTRNLVRDGVLDLGAALGIGFGGIFMGMTAVASILAITGGGPHRIVDLAGSPWGIAAMLLATQLPLAYFAMRRRRRNLEKQRALPELFGGPKSAARLGVVAGFGLTVLSAVYTGIVQSVLGKDSVRNQVEFLRGLLDNKPAVALLIFIIAILAPVCEEFFFRGVVFGSAHRAGKTRAGMALSAILFAAVHLNPLLVPFYATFAVVMCWLYARTGTLAAPIAAHMTMNGVACSALLLVGNAT